MADPKVTVRIGAKDEASGVVKKTQLTFASLGAEISKRFVITAGDVTRAVGSIFRALGSTVTAFGESEQASAKLLASLSKLGPEAEGVAKALESQAAALQQTSTFSDDAIVANQALLATFTQNESQLKAGTQAAVDFAAATGTDLRTAFLLLGKAAAGNTGALSRYGIVIDDALPGTEKFAAAVKALNTQFGGQAAAAADTLAGSIERLKNNYNDVQEGIGQFVAVLNQQTGALTGGNTFLQGYAESLKITANALPGIISNLGGYAAKLNEAAIFLQFGSEAQAAYVQRLEESSTAQADAVASQKALNATRQEATKIAAEAAAQEKLFGDALKLLGVETANTTAEAMARVNQALETLRVEMDAGRLSSEAFAQAQETARAKLTELDPLARATADAFKLLGIESQVTADQGVAKVNAALATAKAAFESGTISANAYALAQRNAADALVALGDKVAVTNARIAATAAEAVAAQEQLAASFRDTADAAEEFGDAAEAAGEQASNASIGIAQFTSARTSDPRTDVEIAAESLATIKQFGSFLSSSSGAGALGAISGAERRLAAARAAESAGATGAGSTAPLSNSPMGRLGGGTRSLSGAASLRGVR